MRKEISREMDITGRLVIPKEMRRELMLRKNEDNDKPNLETGPIEVSMYMEDDKLIIKRKNPSCVFCGTESNLGLKYRDGHICKFCLEEIKKLAAKQS